MATTKKVSFNGFSVSNLRTSRGVEYEAMSCDLMLERKKIAEVIDDGWGGPLNVSMADGFSYSRLDELCKTFREPSKCHGMTIEYDAELFIYDLVEKEKMARDVRRQNGKGYGVCRIEFSNNHRDEYYNIPLEWSDKRLSGDMAKKYPKDPIKAITFWRKPEDFNVNDRQISIEQLRK